MGQIIRRFQDGSLLEYDMGSFDPWCVYLHRPGRPRVPPRDVDYFGQLIQYGRKYGIQKVYTDYCNIYNVTGKEVASPVFDLIEHICGEYRPEDRLECSILLSVLYMAMVAEEKKKNTRLGKRIKRLGIHVMLMEGRDIQDAANFMKGMKWREIDRLCRDRGF